MAGFASPTDALRPNPASSRSPILPAGMTMKTTTAAIRAVTMPTTNVAATAIEKAVGQTAR